MQALCFASHLVWRAWSSKASCAKQGRAHRLDGVQNCGEVYGWVYWHAALCGPWLSYIIKLPGNRYYATSMVQFRFKCYTSRTHMICSARGDFSCQMKTMHHHHKSIISNSMPCHIAQLILDLVVH
ncbi:hypothetical protein CY34DRAFT_388061 [Suillus luteus UH-Slu-Lm8-n1]|uniref:Uncharacterized protein n=1 Tax=Suillus luteus UH-Slu-Lm8-n1 TaxID=930992 RepID=A0A0D0B3X0_9AGAM|nr:hypothetical protein CY34DRAFT_388061 [Suillus luteus UH-Slu-Lm8-n1]